MNKKKIIIIAFLVCLMILGGGTLAYFNSRHTDTTSLSADVYQTRVTDTFTSPDNFVPGTYIEHEMKLTNTGDVKVAVRAKIEESWTSANGDDLSLIQEIQNTANRKKSIVPSFLINHAGDDSSGLNSIRCVPTIVLNSRESRMVRAMDNDCSNLSIGELDVVDWSKDMSQGMLQQGNDNPMLQAQIVENDGYYYYDYFVNPGSSTTPLITSILFNEYAQNDFSCTTNNGVERCTSTGDGYDGATYTLTVTFETVQYDKYQEYWDTEMEIGEYFYHDSFVDEFDVEGWGENKTVDLSNHNFTVTNTSDVSTTLRARVQKKWNSVGGTIDNPLACEESIDCGISIAEINIKTNNNSTIWEKDNQSFDDYYYYMELAPNESVSNLIDSISYANTYSCFKGDCSGEEYANDTLHIKVTYEIVDTDYKDTYFDDNVMSLLG